MCQMKQPHATCRCPHNFTLPKAQGAVPMLTCKQRAGAGARASTWLQARGSKAVAGDIVSTWSWPRRSESGAGDRVGARVQARGSEAVAGDMVSTPSQLHWHVLHWHVCGPHLFSHSYLTTLQDCNVQALHLLMTHTTTTVALLTTVLGGCLHTHFEGTHPSCLPTVLPRNKEQPRSTSTGSKPRWALQPSHVVPNAHNKCMLCMHPKEHGTTG
jgi:hypothetical protein